MIPLTSGFGRKLFRVYNPFTFSFLHFASPLEEAAVAVQHLLGWVSGLDIEVIVCVDDWLVLQLWVNHTACALVSVNLQ